MGISPDAAKKMTLWEFQAVTDYWIETHQTDADKPGSKLSDDEKDELWEWMQTQNIPLTRFKKPNGSPPVNG
jgi:hypothetical protein